MQVSGLQADQISSIYMCATCSEHSGSFLCQSRNQSMCYAEGNNDGHTRFYFQYNAAVVFWMQNQIKLHFEEGSC